jgi:hypothetical protein
MAIAPTSTVTKIVEREGARIKLAHLSRAAQGWCGGKFRVILFKMMGALE